MLKSFYRSFLLALASLTFLPTPDVTSFTAEEKGRGLVWFPVLGALMGVLLAAIAWRLQDVEPILASVVVLTVWLFISELRHLDALARSICSWLFDGFRRDRQGNETNDSSHHLGVMGVIALIMMMKFSALAVLIEYNVWISIFFAPLMARLLVVAFIGFTPTPPGSSLAHEFRIEFPYMGLFVWLLIALPMALIVGIPMLVLLLAMLVIRWCAKHCNGGLTWDSIGATIVLLEALGLFSAALMA